MVNQKKINEFISCIHQNGSDKIEVLFNALESCNYSELKCLYSKVPRIYKGLFSLSFLKRTSFSQINKTSKFIYLNTSEIIGKQVYVILMHSKIINKYLSYKNKYEFLYLNGLYDEARIILNKIDHEISYSYWAMSNYIRMERMQKGVNAAIKVHNEYWHANDNLIIKKFCNAAFYTSALDYSSDIKKKLYYKPENEYAKKLNNLVSTRYFAFEGINEENELCIDFCTSIIDLYNHFIICISNVTQEHITEDIRLGLKEVAEAVEDPYILKLCILYDIKTTKNYNNPIERNSIIKDYVNQNYNNVIENVPNYLKSKNVFDAELLIMLSKSMVNHGSDTSILKNDGTIYESIKYHLCQLLNRKDDVTFHQRKLEDLCKSQFDITEIRYLYFTIKAICNTDIYNLYLNTWRYSKYLNIGDVCFFKDNRKQKLLEWKYDTSIVEACFNFPQQCLSQDCWEISIAGIHDEEMNYQLLVALEQNQIVGYLKSPICLYLFETFIQQKKYKEAVVFFVKNHISDINVNIPIPNSSVNLILELNDIIVKEIPLELAIFYFLINSDIDIIYLAYKQSLRKLNVKKASEVQVTGNTIIDYFLANIAIPRILTLHVLRFKSVEDVINERISICTNLNLFYDKKRFAEEIAGHIRDLKILELNNKVDDNKIYVDTQSIKDNELDEAKALFKMYEQSSSEESVLSESVSMLVHKLREMGIGVEVFLGSLEHGQERVNYQYDILKRMFIYIRDQFLFNPKSGLDNYLSTRIRHGTLINQLRNHFETDNLISNKVNDAYIPNEFWIYSVFGIKDAILKSDCITRFTEFSSKIDALIFKIKDQYVQVRTEQYQEKMEACFNFDIENFEEKLGELHSRSELNSFEAILSEILAILWAHTDDCLEIVKTKLMDVQNLLLEELHAFEKDIEKLVGYKKVSWVKFHDALTQCTNNIQSDIQIVARWFNRSSSVDFDFTIKQVIETCKHGINANNNNKFLVEVECDSFSELKGKYFSTLYDMFHDIMINALNYEREKHTGGICRINAIENEDILKINVSNPIISDNIDEMCEKVNKINRNLENLLSGGISRMEGNSGCIKIFNAVHNHLGSKNNSYSNSIENECFNVNIELDLIPLRK